MMLKPSAGAITTQTGLKFPPAMIHNLYQKIQIGQIIV